MENSIQMLLIYCDVQTVAQLTIINKPKQKNVQVEIMTQETEQLFGLLQKIYFVFIFEY